MPSQFAEKYQRLTDVLQSDQEYLAIFLEYNTAFKEFIAATQALQPTQQETIMQFIGISQELQMREIALALMLE